MFSSRWLRLSSIALVLIAGTVGTWLAVSGDLNPDVRRDSPGADSESPGAPISDTVFVVGPEAQPLEAPSDGYIGSEACRACHKREHATWHDSFHRTMTQTASPDAIVGDFDQTELELYGRKYRLGRDQDKSWVELDETFAGIESPENASLRRNIVQTTGSHHMQAYWLSTGRGRQLAMLPFVWLIDEQRWIPRHMAFLQPPVDADRAPHFVGDELFETGRWNDTCVRCHTTHPQPHVDDPDFPTRVSELGISCETCHGPAAAHVRFHKGESTDKDFADVVHPQRLPHERASEVCGQCHSAAQYQQGGEYHKSIRGSGPTYRPGGNLRDKKRFQGTRPDVFWGDGAVRVTGPEFNGLLTSPCFQRGDMSCFSCHQMHQADQDTRPRHEWLDDQLKPQMRGNEACLQCHPKFRSEKQLTSHTHHAGSSEGSRCYNCHMPNTTYGILKATRNHVVSSPSVRETLEFARPNACNLCHLDQSLQWTAGHLQDWYDQPSPPLEDDLNDIALSVLLSLNGDASLRALMAWHMGWKPAREASSEHWIPPYLAVLMDDDYDAVRLIAHRSLRQIGGYGDIPFDSVAGSAQRANSVKRIWNRWHERSKASPVHNPRLLLDREGNLDQPSMARLLQHRNRTPVKMSE